MSRVWAVNQAALPTQTMGWPSWNLPPAILLPVPSVPSSGTASTILLLSPAICWLSLDHKVTVPLNYCSRGWVSQSGPSWHSFPELLILKRLHIAGLGRILFSSASYTKSNIFCSSGLFCPFSWVKQAPYTVNSSSLFSCPDKHLPYPHSYFDPIPLYSREGLLLGFFFKSMHSYLLCWYF